MGRLIPCRLLDIAGKVEFAPFIVATGWAEFLKRLQRLAGSGGGEPMDSFVLLR